MSRRLQPLPGIAGRGVEIFAIEISFEKSLSRCALPCPTGLSKEKEDILYWSLVESSWRVMERIVTQPSLEERFNKEYFALGALRSNLLKLSPADFLRYPCWDDFGLVLAQLHRSLKKGQGKRRPCSLLRKVKACEKAFSEAMQHRLDYVRVRIAGIEIDGLRPDVTALVRRIEGVARQFCRETQNELLQSSRPRQSRFRRVLV